LSPPSPTSTLRFWIDSTHTMKSTDVVRVRQPSSSSALTTIEAV
jgi:hypothetical protein